MEPGISLAAIPQGAWTIVAILIAFFLGRVSVYVERRIKTRGHWKALKAELRLCGRSAAGVADGEVKSPLYRLPEEAFRASLLSLIAEGQLEEHDAFALLDYLTRIEDLNRGLDYAADMAHAHDSPGLEREYKRNMMKAGKMRSPDSPGVTNYFMEVSEIVERHLTKTFVDLIIGA